MSSSPPKPEEEDQVSRDVMDLLLLSYSHGLDALIRTLAVNGLISPDQIEAIHSVMAPPLDHNELSGDENLAFLRQKFDESFAQSRLAASNACGSTD